MLGIPRSLWLLNGLQLKGEWRRFTRGLKTVRGLLLTIFTALIFVTWLAPMIAGTYLRSDLPRPAYLHEWIVFGLVFVLLAQLIFPSKQYLAFSPVETQFLFAGPFTRQQLLLFKLSRTVALLFTGGVFLSLFLGRFAGSWLASLLNVWMALAFFQLCSIGLSLVVGIVERRTYSRFRRGLLFGIVAAIAVLVAFAAPDLGDLDLDRIRENVLESAWYRYGFAPVHVFAFGLTSPTLIPDGVTWAITGAVLNFMIGYLVLKLDADYREAAMEAGVKRYEQMRRIRSGGGAFPAKLSTRRLFRVPSIPRWSGVGVIVRRHFIALSRSRAILWLFGIIAVLSLSLGMTMRDAEPGEQMGILVGVPLGAAVYLAIFAGTALRADFRGEVGTMDQLKSLPVSAYAIGLGQVLVPTLIITAALAVFGLVMGAASGHLLVATGIAIGLVPVNLALFAIDNFFFLLYPVHATALSGNPQVIGLLALLWIAKGLVMLFGVGIAAGVAGLLYWLFLPGAAAIVVAWLILLGLALLATMGVGWAFMRFDPSRESPA